MWPFSKSLPVPSVGRSPALSAIRYRPTRLGAGMAVVVVLLWLVGVNYQVNLAYAAAFWLLGFLIVGVLLTLRQLLSLQIDVEMPKEVFAGQEAELHLRAVNNRRQRQLWLCSEDDFLNGDRPSENLWQAWTRQGRKSSFGAFPHACADGCACRRCVPLQLRRLA